MAQTTARLILMLTLAGLAAGCAAQRPANDNDHEREVGAIRTANTATRRGAAVVQGGVLLARSFPVDPINRPVSNLLSLSSYALKSATGLLRRLLIGGAQFPVLETRVIPELSSAGYMDLESFEAYLDRMTGREASSGTIRFLVDGDEYFSRLEEAMWAATDSIDVRTYIFDNDDYAVQVANILRDKSADVDVRVMVDGLGNLMAMQTDPASMSDSFQPPLSIEQYLERNSNVHVRTLSNPWMTGDHTKTTIIDRETAFVGGMNIGREYRHEWHDVMMEVTGPIVDQLQFDLDRAWARAGVMGDLANFVESIEGARPTAKPGGYPVRALYTRNFDSQIYRAQLAAIRRSSSFILIENGYFSDDATIYELAKARRRGVDVRVILPEDGNHGTHDASNAISINKMLRNGIRVYRYPGMSHVKAAIIDGWASVGTANFDKLSLQVNKEVNLATSHAPAVLELMTRVFMPDLALSTEITQMVEVSLPDRLVEVLVDEAL